MRRRIVPPIHILATHAEIELQRGLRALIDLEDVPIATGLLWSVNRGGYVVARVGPRSWVYLHDLIVCPPDGMSVDHIDHDDTLDNRSQNLREATASQQLQNSSRIGRSGFKGVSWVKRRATNPRPWVAQIRADDSKQHLGYFATREAAAEAYDAAAVHHFGDWALTNRMLGLL